MIFPELMNILLVDVDLNKRESLYVLSNLFNRSDPKTLNDLANNKLLEVVKSILNISLVGNNLAKLAGLNIFTHCLQIECSEIGKWAVYDEDFLNFLDAQSDSQEMMMKLKAEELIELIQVHY